MGVDYFGGDNWLPSSLQSAGLSAVMDPAERGSAAQAVT